MTNCTMKNPKVSVIVICYNQRDTISRALDSVLAQEDCDYEVIIGDDASADGTRCARSMPAVIPGVCG